MADLRYQLDHSERDTMRDFTDHEIGLYYMLKRCPMCAEPTANFIYGPVGGASVNIECPHCKARFNVYDARGKDRWYPVRAGDPRAATGLLASARGIALMARNPLVTMMGASEPR